MEGEIHDRKDDIFQVAQLQTWRPATHVGEVMDFEQPVGPNCSLPVNAKRLDWFFFVSVVSHHNFGYRTK